MDILLECTAVYVLLTLFEYNTSNFSKIIFSMIIIGILNTIINNKNNKFEKEKRHQENSKKILESIIELNDTLLKVEKTEELFQLIMESAVGIIENAQMGSLMILDQKTQKLEYKAAVGFEMSTLKQINLKLEDTFLWRSNNGNITNACIVNDVEVFNQVVIDKKTFNKMKDTDFHSTMSAISAPIIINEVLYGMINVDNTSLEVFNESDLLLLEFFASQVGAVIQRHQLLEKMLFLSQYDSLTNVYNRSYFEEVFLKTCKKLTPERDHFSLVLFDLDNLKTTNDTYGHYVGDLLLKEFADRLERTCSPDLFARYGGDEFIAVFFNEDEGTVGPKLQDIIKSFANSPLKFKEHHLPVKFSYGISSYPKNSTDLKKLISKADKRMYVSKNNRKSKEGSSF